MFILKITFLFVQLFAIIKPKNLAANDERIVGDLSGMIRRK